MKHAVSTLEGAQLDLAVAMAGEEWKTAHRFFPTMTLDPTFKGAHIVSIQWSRYEPDAPRCLLIPNNSFRQEPQVYTPSTDGAFGTPIMERERISVAPHPLLDVWIACARIRPDGSVGNATGPTLLVAAMRAFVISKVGLEVELP